MLVTLRQIVQEVSAATHLDDVLDIIVHRVKEALSIDACAVYLTDVERHHYVLMAAEGFHQASIGEVRIDRKEGLLGQVGERRELMTVSDAAAHPRYLPSTATGEERYQSFLGVPLIHYHHVLGVLVAWKQAPGQFDKNEETFFLTIAAQLAKAIHQAAEVDEVARMLSGEKQGDAFIQGMQMAAGLAIGTAALLNPLAKLESIPDCRTQDIAAEETAFRSAVAAVNEELRASRERLAADVASEVRALFDVYAMMLGSDGLVSDALARIRAGNWAPGAWRDTIADHAKVFEQMEDPYLRKGEEDIRTIGQRVLLQLQAEAEESRQYPQQCVLVGDTVSIMEISAVPVGQLVGIVCMHGSALSHTAVMARALGIPAVVSLAPVPIGRLDGCEMVIDGDQGRIYIEPSRVVAEAYQQLIGEQQARSERLMALRDLPAETPDGVRLPLYANVGRASDIVAARDSGAEGVGLYRTEYHFLLREAFPLEDEQYQIYREVLENFAPSPVTLRTLDVGGDKILPYFPVQEDNPFLGCRGIRFSLDHPEIFLIQLRAMLRANAGLNNLQVLFPMISRVSELDEAMGLLARAYQELLEEGLTTAKIRVGVMIEVPSAIFLADTLADRVDFLSIGTNDLTQYMLAVDRNNAQVVTPYDSLHPAVLNAIHHVIKAANRRGKPVSVCGEMAGDPAGALLLLGMGVNALSMSAASLVRVKLVIRSFTLQRARLLLDEALGMEDGFAIHRLLSGALEEVGV
ncbi:MAG: phosphoenolpyruvate--protein phosphotransferase [Candidatus Thiodiazotropha sp. (ex. Lucinisca nassula)]|nr:phosphoenolpyruvate--protein phosphotransferase [Candidatus Thiodiazotropha sp. (ex. Lucinisca nassula)]